MNGNLFLVAAVINPNNKEFEETGKLSEIVLQPKTIIAKDEKDAAIKVVLDCSELKEVDRNKLEVIVRPF